MRKKLLLSLALPVVLAGCNNNSEIQGSLIDASDVPNVISTTSAANEKSNSDEKITTEAYTTQQVTEEETSEQETEPEVEVTFDKLRDNIVDVFYVLDIGVITADNEVDMDIEKSDIGYGVYFIPEEAIVYRLDKYYKQKFILDKGRDTYSVSNPYIVYEIDGKIYSIEGEEISPAEDISFNTGGKHVFYLVEDVLYDKYIQYTYEFKDGELIERLTQDDESPKMVMRYVDRIFDCDAGYGEGAYVISNKDNQSVYNEHGELSFTLVDGRSTEDIIDIIDLKSLAMVEYSDKTIEIYDKNSYYYYNYLKDEETVALAECCTELNQNYGIVKIILEDNDAYVICHNNELYKITVKLPDKY